MREEEPLFVGMLTDFPYADIFQGSRGLLSSSVVGMQGHCVNAWSVPNVVVAILALLHIAT